MDTTPHIRQKPTPSGETTGMSPAPRPGNPSQEPIPGGNIPTEVPLSDPDEFPDTGPTGPRTPYPVNDPGVGDPTGPGSEPDYLPGRPTSPMQI